MFYLRSTGCTYDVKIVQLDSNGNLPSNLDNYGVLAHGTYDGEGYLTATLNIPYNFVSNNKCAIVVKLSPLTSSSKIYLPYEGTFQRFKNSAIVCPEINSLESFYAVDSDYESLVWNDCKNDEEYSADSNKGNLIIRPVLSKSNRVPENITITPSEIIDSGNDVNVQINGNASLFNIHTLSNMVLKQDIDYVRTNTGITLKSNFINSLNEEYTELIFEFNNDTTKTLVINPKATITDVSITGKPVVGNTLTATCVGVPEKDEYNVNYQWQSSLNGNNWYDISNENSSTYIVTENVVNRYLRVKITSNVFGNVEYPTEKYSESTQCKAVILGDVNLDGTVTISDCTQLQRYLAGSVTLNAEQLLASDANKDNIINISDTTAIQRIIMLH